ncbi:hypothetical protein HON58_03975 [Candidatus Peregrinibacteria bacterium]|jgi:hypothetical protein|nr:hypothetical protein [Candidatus Peregrinibacteria bacterium]
MKKLIISLVILTAFSQAAFAEMILFTSDSCSFCNELKTELRSKNLYFKHNITEYEISTPQNAALYLEKSQEVGYTSGGIPLLIEGGEYFEGKSPIMKHLEGIEEVSAPAVTIISEEDSLDLQIMLEEASESTPSDQTQEKDSSEGTTNSSTIIIGIIAIVFGLTLFTTIILRAKKRFKI